MRPSLLTTLLLLLAATAVPAAELAPYQQAALDRILATLDAETREYAQPQLEQMLAVMGEAEVNLLVQAMLEQAPDNPSDEAPDQVPGDDGGATASPADLEFNRAQYEPALREAWAASRAFDTFVDETLAAECPGQDEYAAFGSAWRYELAPMQPHWTRASDSADLDVQILGSSYAPQDGRYRFDFTGVRNEFDRAAVKGAIVDACAEYRDIGAAFLADVRADMQGDYPPNGFDIEAAANARAVPLINALSERLQALGPAGNAPILNALVTGAPAN